MKKIAIVALLGFLGLIGPAGAQAPNLLNYQGVLKDSAGNPITGTRAMTFRLYDAATGGTLLWNETQPSVSVNNGLFSVLLGSVTPLSPSNFSGPNRWLGVTVASDPEMTPRQRIASAAYALSLSSQTAVVRVLLNICGGACAGYHTLNTWFNIGASYGHSVSNGDPATFTTTTNGSVTLNRTGTYMIRIRQLQIPTADSSYRYGCPFINGGANCLGASAVDYVPHFRTFAGWWGSSTHTFVATLSAGTVVSYGYYPVQALNYWAYDYYTGMEIIRLN